MNTDFTDADRLRCERTGRDLVRRYGSPREVAGMEARINPASPRKAKTEAQAEAYRMRQFGLQICVIAKRLRRHKRTVANWFSVGSGAR